MTWTAPEAKIVDGSTAADERTMLAGYLDWHRSVLLHKCAGLTGEQLAKQSVEPSRLSLLGLIRHMAKVERIWFRERFAGLPVERLHKGTDTDFDQVDPARAAEEYAQLLEERRLADEVAAKAELDDTFTYDGEVFSLRFVYLHLIQEYARHNGHADLVRERVDGVTGD
ncbi:DinB family protein [Amycolatopsis sp.]|uniref:DinB family protein n=1 Tax=Amycolatopsis sp. TaxID=37632 RepID=UPI002C92E98E|nr:DinB family protein [Amycolatopsis sp.]HVV09131.1 DinB family protein [Amycolatopsis sp.]